MKRFIAMVTAATVLFVGVPGLALPEKADASSDWGKVVGAVIGAILNSGESKDDSQSAEGSNPSGTKGTGGPRNGSNRVIEREPTTNERMFFVALDKGDTATVQQMLDAGVDINAFYRFIYATPLGRAMRNNDRAMMQFLLERGADVRGYNSRQNSYEPHSYLVQAAERNDLPLVEYLHNWGADVNSVEHYVGNDRRNALFYVNLSGNGSDVFRYLVSQGIDVNYRTEWLGTPLMRVADTWLSTEEKREYLKILLDAGADPHLKDKSGHTAIDYCLERNDLENAQFLQKY